MISGYICNTTYTKNTMTGNMIQYLHTISKGDDKQKGKHYETTKSRFKINEQEKTNKQKALNDEERGNLSEKEFRVMTVNKIHDLGKRMRSQMEKFF